MPLGFVLLDQGFKLQPREHLQQLRKNAAYSIQAEVSDPEDWFFSGNPILQYRSSAANLIWTGVVPDLPSASGYTMQVLPQEAPPSRLPEEGILASSGSRRALGGFFVSGLLIAFLGA